ncbi:ABC transporter permease [Autumnicola edwardsiae]|uniref:Transport permease protein n=1 Tax=Autumnicola edwardsiae TaxID=3075594 RepID=A0ABU3CRU7_9FLAO|nr:ABC transporter permease [Zunongwangia sp. F297]MDT0649084.1 ABC transporter permease [Zunongwangia sp. F297]
MDKNQDIPWSLVVTPKSNWLNLNLREIWRYKDLVFLFLKRDIVTVYKQTILGPLWFIIQPVLTTLVFTVIFGNIANISTDGLPHVLFYLSGIVVWNYFADCIKNTADAFKANENIFGKVYFPRVIVPLSTVLSNLVKFGIQFLLFIGVLIFYTFKIDLPAIGLDIIILPFLIVLVALLSLGCGMIISSLTTKYRDLSFLISFGIQLLMYATPVIYPLSEAPEEYRPFILANPMSSLIESFRNIFLGTGEISFSHLLYSLIFTVVIFLAGLIVFNKTEKTFMDTV